MEKKRDCALVNKYLVGRVKWIEPDSSQGKGQDTMGTGWSTANCIFKWNFYREGDWTPEGVAWRGWGDSMLGDIQHSTHQADPALSRKIGLDNLLNSSHPAHLRVADFCQVPFRRRTESSMQTISMRKDYKLQLLEKVPLDEASISTNQQFGRATDSTRCTQAA